MEDYELGLRENTLFYSDNGTHLNASSVPVNKSRWQSDTTADRDPCCSSPIGRG